jgi:hypothetical protein
VSDIKTYPEITHRDPVPKTLVRSFAANYPDETDEQLHARMERAWHKMSSAEFPLTVEAVTYWRQEAGR